MLTPSEPILNDAELAREASLQEAPPGVSREEHLMRIADEARRIDAMCAAALRDLDGLRSAGAQSARGALARTRLMCGGIERAVNCTGLW